MDPSLTMPGTNKRGLLVGPEVLRSLSANCWCEVRADCLLFALAAAELVGFWATHDLAGD